MPLTFAQILVRTRREATHAAWDRALTASRLRHLAQGQGKPRAARVLSRVKGRALALVARLAPDAVRMRRDLAHPGAHLSLQLRQRGRLHVPPAHELELLAGPAGQMTRATG